MLPLPLTSYEAPDSVAEALRLSREPGAQIIAGGTDLLPSMKHRIFTPRLLVSTRRLAPLRGIVASADGSLDIGASETLGVIARNPDVARRFPALAAACRTVATPTIQGMATLGGNILLDTRCMYYNQPEGWRQSLGGCLKCIGDTCHVAPKGKGCYAAHSADTAPALILAGASAVFHTELGEEEVALSALYQDDGMRWLARSGVLVRVRIPALKNPIVHRKLRARGAIDYGMLLTAVSRSSQGWSAVISAVGPKPIRVSAPTPQSLAEAAFAAAQPLSTHLQPATWRKKMVRVEVGRAAAELG